MTGPGDAWPVPRRRSAAYRLRMAATDLGDIAAEVRSTGPRPGHAEQLREVGDMCRRLAHEFDHPADRPHVTREDGEPPGSRQW